jgi:hypothetical protein
LPCDAPWRRLECGQGLKVALLRESDEHTVLSCFLKER